MNCREHYEQLTVGTHVETDKKNYLSIISNAIEFIVKESVNSSFKKAAWTFYKNSENKTLEATLYEKLQRIYYINDCKGANDDIQNSQVHEQAAVLNSQNSNTTSQIVLDASENTLFKSSHQNVNSIYLSASFDEEDLIFQHEKIGDDAENTPNTSLNVSKTELNISDDGLTFDKPIVLTNESPYSVPFCESVSLKPRTKNTLKLQIDNFASSSHNINENTKKSTLSPALFNDIHMYQPLEKNLDYTFESGPGPVNSMEVTWCDVDASKESNDLISDSEDEILSQLTFISDKFSQKTSQENFDKIRTDYQPDCIRNEEFLLIKENSTKIDSHLGLISHKLIKEDSNKADYFSETYERTSSSTNCLYSQHFVVDNTITNNVIEKELESVICTTCPTDISDVDIQTRQNCRPSKTFENIYKPGAIASTSNPGEIEQEVEFIFYKLHGQKHLRETQSFSSESSVNFAAANETVTTCDKSTNKIDSFLYDVSRKFLIKTNEDLDQSYTPPLKMTKLKANDNFSAP